MSDKSVHQELLAMRISDSFEGMCEVMKMSKSEAIAQSIHEKPVAVAILIAYAAGTMQWSLIKTQEVINNCGMSDVDFVKVALEEF